MLSRPAANFDDVRHRERELNSRQREILDLIEKGHTNREIAELLDLSVDGAKWNVSEILSKLGLESREVAAEYWRWRRTSGPAVTRWLRALLGVPAVKWTAGSVAVVGVAGMGVLAAMGGGTGPEPVPDPPTHEFYVEAAVHYANPEYPADYAFRWWHKDADHTRWDYDRTKPAMQTSHRTTIVEGANATTFSPEGTKKLVAPAAPPDGLIRRPQDIVLIGPASYSNLGDLLAELSTWNEGSQAATVVRYEKVTGFNTAVIEYAHGTMWVEPSEMLIVQHHSDQSRVTLTKFEKRVIDWDEVALPAAVAAMPVPTPFVFTPGQPRFPLPQLMDALKPAYIPVAVSDGLGIGSGGADCEEAVPMCYSEMIYLSEAQMRTNQGLPGTPLRNGQYLRIEQRLGLAEMPAALMTGTPTPMRGVTGYLDVSGPSPSLAWQEPDGRIVRIEGSQLPVNEVLKVAESLGK
jgi:DNA-binding CsgD family transcriptional regulator